MSGHCTQVWNYNNIRLDKSVAKILGPFIDEIRKKYVVEMRSLYTGLMGNSNFRNEIHTFYQLNVWPYMTKTNVM